MGDSHLILMRSKAMEISKLPTLLPRDDDRVFSDLHHEIDRVFSSFSHGFPMLGRAWTGVQRPIMDVKDTGKALEVSVELPGLADADVDVSVADRLLKISGEKKTEDERKEADYHVMERSYGKFSRSLTLPYAPDTEKIEAKFDKGVLTVSVPKPPEEATATKKIPVKAVA
jgi:HSP20 family protein